MMHSPGNEVSGVHWLEYDGESQVRVSSVALTRKKKMPSKTDNQSTVDSCEKCIVGNNY